LIQMKKMWTKVYKKKGKNLTQDELDTINKIRKIEFEGFASAQHPIKPQQGNEHWQELYFLVKTSENSLTAFARIQEVDIKFMRQNYSILGIVTVASAVKGQGYGKILLKEMVNHITKIEKTAIAFTDRKTSSFYHQFGFTVIPDGSVRFFHGTPDGKLISDELVSDVVCLNGQDNLIEAITQNPEEKVLLPKPQW